MATGLVTPHVPGAVEALNRINRIVTAQCESQMFYAACNLGIFDLLARGPAPADELAASLSANVQACQSLLNALHGIGLVERAGGRFSNNSVGDHLIANAPVNLEPMGMWGGLFAPTWTHLDDAVREGS